MRFLLYLMFFLGCNRSLKLLGPYFSCKPIYKIFAYAYLQLACKMCEIFGLSDFNGELLFEWCVDRCSCFLALITVNALLICYSYNYRPNGYCTSSLTTTVWKFCNLKLLVRGFKKKTQKFQQERSLISIQYTLRVEM